VSVSDVPSTLSKELMRVLMWFCNKQGQQAVSNVQEQLSKLTIHSMGRQRLAFPSLYFFHLIFE
jgi:hypothetical protein